MSSGEEDSDIDIPGRGMLRVELLKGGVIEMENLDTGAKFHFARDDMDEVIGTLSIYRLAIEAGEYEDGNGRV